MKLTDFHECNPLQRDMLDEDATATAKQSMVEIMRSLGINGTPIPAPKIPEGNLVEDLYKGYNRQYYDDPMFEGKAEYIPLLYMFRNWMPAAAINGGNQWKYFVQDMSTICYYLACNQMRIESFPSLQEKDLRILAHFNFDREKPEERWHVEIAFEETPILQIKVVQSLRSEYQNDMELPDDLVEHIRQFASVEDMITEVCRIQMLGPKYRRADDAMGSLINAWNTMRSIRGA